ncbi:hypothetical protein C2E23DRAFT_856837 [Lenzites betulinus]|nr:hypothetical protein C2E23DRAFT_858073 [Lenzites betulinus]KAH9856514.1 hypothetical protein C2E23DRAFT_856837 [Lenzites betulinus]
MPISSVRELPKKFDHVTRFSDLGLGWLVAARAIDSSGHEGARQTAHVQNTLATASKHAQEQQEKKDKANAIRIKLNATVLILDHEAVPRITIPVLDEQLEVYRKRENDPSVPGKSKLKRKAEKLEALVRAIERYRARMGYLA